MASTPSSRNTEQKMRYIHPNPPAGAGLPSGPRFSKEEYSRLRREFTDPRTVTFFDARTALPGGLSAWDLDTHGFTMVRPPPQPSDFRSQKTLNEEYYPKLAELAKKVTGGKHCVFFYDLVRTEDRSNPDNAYAGFAHSDGCASSIGAFRQALVQSGVPEAEAATCDILMAGIWHPIDRPAFKNPLCLLDGSTVHTPEDLKVIEMLHKAETLSAMTEKQWRVFGERSKMFSRTSEEAGQRKVLSNLMGPVYSPSHRWVYISDQRPDECWLFKHYDTREDRVQSCFHTSFHDPYHEDEPDDSHGRRSAEFRCLLTFPKEGGPTVPASSDSDLGFAVVGGVRGNSKL